MTVLQVLHLNATRADMCGSFWPLPPYPAFFPSYKLGQRVSESGQSLSNKPIFKIIIIIFLILLHVTSSNLHLIPYM